VALNLDDGLLDQFEKLPDAEAKQMFSAMTPDERSQLSAYMPGWKERKAAANVAPGSAAISAAPEALSSQPLFTDASVPASFQPETSSQLAQPPIASPWQEAPEPGLMDRAAEHVRTFDQKQSALGFGATLTHPMQTLENVQQHITGPAVETFQEKVGAPVVNKAAEGYRAFGDLVNIDMSTPELLMRSFASVGAGPTYESMSEKDRLHAVNMLESYLGTTGTAFALGTTQELGKLPLLLAGGEVVEGAGIIGQGAAKLGITPQTAEMFPYFTRLLGQAGKALGQTVGGAVEGFAFGAAEALLNKNKPVGETVATSTLGGAGLSAAAGAVPAIANVAAESGVVQGAAHAASAGARAVGQFAKDTAQAAKVGAQQLFKPYTSDVLALVTPEGAAGLVKDLYGMVEEAISMPVPAKSELAREGTPMMVPIKGALPEDFKPTIALPHVDAEGNPTLAVVEINIGEPGRFISIPDDQHADDVLRELGVEVKAHAPQNGDEVIAKADELAPDTRAKKELIRSKPTTGSGTAPGRKRTPAPNPDAPPPGNPELPPMVAVRSGNKVKLKAAAPEAPVSPSALPELGDDVSVAVGPDRVTGTVEGKTPDGKYVVRTDRDEVMTVTESQVARLKQGAQANVQRRLADGGFDVFFDNEDVREFLISRKVFSAKQFAKALGVSEVEAMRALEALEGVAGVKKTIHENGRITYEPSVHKLRAREAQEVWNIARNERLSPNEVFPDANPRVGHAYGHLDEAPTSTNPKVNAETGAPTGEPLMVETPAPAPGPHEPDIKALEETLAREKELNERLKREANEPPPKGGEDLPPTSRWKRGDAVFTGKTTGEQAQHGRVIGKGNRPGYVAVQVRQTVRDAAGKVVVRAQTVHVPETQLHPINVAKNNALFKKHGIALPRPLNAADIPDDVAHEFEATRKLADALRNANRSLPTKVADSLYRNLVPPHFRGPLEQRLKIQQLLAAKQVGSPDDIFADLTDALGGSKEVRKAFDVDVAKVAEGRLSPAEMQDKYGDRWTTFRDAVMEPFIKERALIEQRLTELGALPQSIRELREDGSMDEYVARMYRAYTDRANWPKHVTQDVIDNAIGEIVKLKKEHGEFVDPTVITAEIMRILQKEDPLKALIHSDLIPRTSKLRNSDSLKRRTDLPDWVRELMGEETSGAIRMAQSLANGRSNLVNLEAWKDIADARVIGPDGKEFNPYWSPGWRPDLPIAIPNDPRLYGKAAGGFTDENYGQLVNLPKFTDNTMAWLHDTIGWMKFNEVAAGGFKVWITNTMGNVLFSRLAGGLDLLRPRESGMAFRDALKAFWEHKEVRNGIRRSGELADYIREAQEFGAIMSGFGQSEMLGKGGDVQRMMREALNTLPNEASLFDYLRFFGKKVTAKGADGKAWIANAYDQIDQVFKLANYISLKKKFARKYGTGPGMNEKAAQMAAYRINQSFPNPVAPVPLADKARKNAVGLAAKYGTYAAESARIFGSLPFRMAPYRLEKDAATGIAKWIPNEERAELPIRLAASAAIAYGLWGDKGALGHARRLNGITDEEVELAKKSLTNEQARYRPTLIALPWRDSKNRAQLLDATSWLDPAKYLSGHGHDPIANRILANVLTAPVAGGFSEAAMQAVLERINLVKARRVVQPLPGNDALTEMANLGVELSLIPKAPMSLAKDLEQMTTDDPYRERLTGPQVAENAFVKVLPVTTDPDVISPSRAASARETTMELQQQLRKNFARIILNRKMKMPEKMRRIKAAADEALAAGVDIQEINDAMMATENVQ
jgi:hypothetical protein